MRSKRERKRKRERENKEGKGCEGKTELERTFVHVRERDRECVCDCVIERQTEREAKSDKRSVRQRDIKREQQQHGREKQRERNSKKGKEDTCKNEYTREFRCAFARGRESGGREKNERETCRWTMIEMNGHKAMINKTMQRKINSSTPARQTDVVSASFCLHVRRCRVHTLVSCLWHDRMHRRREKSRKCCRGLCICEIRVHTRVPRFQL